MLKIRENTEYTQLPEQLQNTPQLIYMSLNKNSVYCVMPRSSKPSDTCKWGGPKLRGILKFSPTAQVFKRQFSLSGKICGSRISTYCHGEYTTRSFWKLKFFTSRHNFFCLFILLSKLNKEPCSWWILELSIYHTGK